MSGRIGYGDLVLSSDEARRGPLVAFHFVALLYSTVQTNSIGEFAKKTRGYGTVVFIPSLGVTGWSTVSICSTTRQMSD